MTCRDRSIRLTIGCVAAVVLVGACSTQNESPGPTTSTVTSAPSATAEPSVPVELQRLIDATSLRDLDESYADFELPPADDHIAVTVGNEDDAASQAPLAVPEAIYSHSLFSRTRSVAHFVSALPLQGSSDLVCHHFGPLFGVCGPAATDQWVEPLLLGRGTQGRAREAIYGLDATAVLVDVVFENGLRQRQQPAAGVILVSFEDVAPIELTVYWADGTTENFAVAPPPQPTPSE